MITNERQYRITNGQVSRLKNAIEKFDFNETAQRLGSKLLAQAELDAMISEVDNLESQLREYDALKSGGQFSLRAFKIADLPRVLIQARIIQGLTQRDLASLVSLKEQQIQRYESESYSSASLRRLLEIADALKISTAEIADISISSKDIKPKSKIDWNKFPIKEMYKRGWFGDLSENLDAVIEERELLTRNYIQRFISKPLVALHKLHIRSNSQIDQYALLAWKCRILSLAENETTKSTFNREIVDSEWIKELVQLSQFSDGPLEAKKMLNEAGILLIIEPHLEGTFLDGAAIFTKVNPIIGMTLRYDRIDNFWFVLLHELMHILHHINKDGIDNIYDDLDYLDFDDIEIEANALAREALIPETEWNIALARYTRSKEAVLDFSNKIRINPAIVAGRIRYEANNFIMLNELIGQGEIRKLFSNVAFGV